MSLIDEFLRRIIDIITALDIHSGSKNQRGDQAFVVFAGL